MLKEPLVINNFQKGIAQSSYLGFEEIRGLNIKRKPGVCFPNEIMQKQSASAVSGLITSISQIASGYYGEDSSKFYLITPGVTHVEKTGHSAGTIHHNVNYKGYVVLSISSAPYKLDGYDGTTWTNNFAQTTSAASDMLWATDDCLYIACGRYLDKLSENAGQTFNPASAGTFTMSQNVLDLPSGESITSIAELNGKLYLASGGNLYPWDHYNTAPSFDSAIKVNDGNINYMIVKNNVIYINSGARGNWYICNGVSVSPIARMPETLLGLGDTSSLNFYNKAICINEGKIFFGLSSASTNSPMGIWSLDTNDNSINFEYLISTYSDGSSAQLAIGALFSTGDNSTTKILSTWRDSSSYGVDCVYSGQHSVNDSYYLVSELFTVGSKRNKHTFREFNIMLAKPLVTNDSVKVYYRKEKNGAWTQIGSTFNTVGESSVAIDFGAADIEKIQFKIVLNNTAELLLATAI